MLCNEQEELAKKNPDDDFLKEIVSINSNKLFIDK